MMTSAPRQDIQLKSSRLNASDCVSPTASPTSAVYARPCCPHASRHVLDRHKFPGGRPPYKSNFYCHPGRAGGTPMLIVRQVSGHSCAQIDNTMTSVTWPGSSSPARRHLQGTGGRRSRYRPLRTTGGLTWLVRQVFANRFSTSMVGFSSRRYRASKGPQVHP